MKVYFSQTEPELNGYTHVGNPNMLDILLDNAEATHIIVNDGLSMVDFKELPNLFSLLCSKLRLKGEMVVYYTDFDLINAQYERGNIGIEEVNEKLSGKKCILNDSVVGELVSQNNLTVTKRGYNSNYQAYMVMNR